MRADPQAGPGRGPPPAAADVDAGGALCDREALPGSPIAPVPPLADGSRGERGGGFPAVQDPADFIAGDRLPGRRGVTSLRLSMAAASGPLLRGPFFL